MLMRERRVLPRDGEWVGNGKRGEGDEKGRLLKQMGKVLIIFGVTRESTRRRIREAREIDAQRISQASGPIE
jgi:hypothetical protein